MKSPLASLLCTLVTLSVSSAFSQETTPDGEQPGINGFWEVVTSGGRFVSRLDQISSVSQHEYLIDGAVRVFECTVDTDGGQTARFYYKVGVGDVDTVVTKHYPDTTHAKTSEYRMKNKATIGQIYDHVRRVWAEERGKGGQNQLIIRNG